LISGIIVSGFGCGSLIFNTVALDLVNPQGYSPVDGKFPASVDEEVPHMIRSLALAFGCLALFSIVTIFDGEKRAEEVVPWPLVEDNYNQLLVISEGGEEMTGSRRFTSGRSSSLYSASHL
jgi:hypothetical protein